MQDGGRLAGEFPLEYRGSLLFGEQLTAPFSLTRERIRQINDVVRLAVEER